MKKKLLLTLCCSLMLISFTGCQKTIWEMGNEEGSIVINPDDTEQFQDEDLREEDITKAVSGDSNKDFTEKLIITNTDDYNFIISSCTYSAKSRTTVLIGAIHFKTEQRGQTITLKLSNVMGDTLAFRQITISEGTGEIVNFTIDAEMRDAKTISDDVFKIELYQEN